LVRTIKNPDERKNEIMDAANQLFYLKGYQQTSVEEIIKKAGIAKGTFYYYFKSKEDILDAIVKRAVAATVSDTLKIASLDGMGAMEKLKLIFTEQSKSSDIASEVIENLHQLKNVDLHQKMIVETTLQYAPVLGNVIKQGINEGVFKTDYPDEVMEFIIVGMQFIFDPGIFKWTKKQFAQRVNALIEMMENILNVEKGSFSYIMDLLLKSSLSPRTEI
jgi:AcrR family transcriptional regulator